jgi:hypothetical protein
MCSHGRRKLGPACGVEIVRVVYDLSHAPVAPSLFQASLSCMEKRKQQTPTVTKLETSPTRAPAKLAPRLQPVHR